jgi:hypothetical protein
MPQSLSVLKSIVHSHGNAPGPAYHTPTVFQDEAVEEFRISTYRVRTRGNIVGISVDHEGLWLQGEYKHCIMEL